MRLFLQRAYFWRHLKSCMAKRTCFATYSFSNSPPRPTPCLLPPAAAVLTLLSCIAASPRARRALCAIQARAQLLQFGQAVADTRLRARALSLVKVLNKAELRAPQH